MLYNKPVEIRLKLQWLTAYPAVYMYITITNNTNVGHVDGMDDTITASTCNNCFDDLTRSSLLLDITFLFAVWLCLLEKTKILKLLPNLKKA